jgi:hypothetical protein
MGANISFCPGSKINLRCNCRKKTSEVAHAEPITGANHHFMVIPVDKNVKTFTLGPGDSEKVEVFLVDRTLCFMAASGPRFEEDWGIPPTALLGKHFRDPDLPFSKMEGLFEFYGQVYSETLKGKILSFYVGWKDFYYEVNTFPQVDPFDKKHIWGAMLIAAYRGAPPVDIQSLEVTNMQRSVSEGCTEEGVSFPEKGKDPSKGEGP